MEHRKYEELMKIYFSGEADENQKKELKAHIAECSICREDFEYYSRIKEMTAKSPIRKVPDRLLSDARQGLRDRLRIERSRRSLYQRWLDNIKRFFDYNYKYVLNGAVTMALGLVIGFFVFKDSEPVNTTRNFSPAGEIPDDISQIRNIRLIDPDPYDDEISFSYEAVRQLNISGSINDDKIKNILMYAILNGNNPGVRLNSLNVLNNSMQGQPDNEIKDGIISAVKYDDNPGVRREALKY
jgi:hypothetical protein